LAIPQLSRVLRTLQAEPNASNPSAALILLMASVRQAMCQ
jgi:hypothetical protein